MKSCFTSFIAATAIIILSTAMLTACGPLVDPEVVTTTPYDVTLTTALSGGEIVVDGRVKLTARGVCWSEDPDPTLDDTHTDEGTETGVFESEITGLTESTVYHVRAYATTELGTVYGPDVTFVASLQDIDGNIYRAVKIGTQVWMAENLKVTHYRDGEAIPNVTDNTEWRSLIDNSDHWPGDPPVPPERFDAYCAYKNDNSYADTYGLLYNWWTTSLDDVAPISEDVYHDNLAPAGWHVPSDEEWQTLEMFLGMTQQQADAPNGTTGFLWDRGNDEGAKLKEVGYEHWDESLIDTTIPATDDYGFTALPTGYRYFDGSFPGTVVNDTLRQYTFFWTTRNRDGGTSWCRGLGYARNYVGRGPQPIRHGYAVRCVRDEE